MNILHISCSPRGQAAESHRLSQKIVGFLRESEPEATVVNRVLGAGAISHIDWNYATAQHSSTTDASQGGTTSQSDVLIQELEAADVVVIGTPMHNFSIPSSLKAWIDHVVRDRRTFNVTRQGKVGVLTDRPVYIAVASGGKFSGENARQPDFLTPYLKLILGTIGLHDVMFFTVEGTGASEDTVAQTRAKTDQALRTFFTARSMAAASLQRPKVPQSPASSPA